MAPRLLSCFRPCRGASSSPTNLPESNATADLTVEEQRRMAPVLLELFSSQGCGTSLEAEAVASRLGRGELLPAAGDGDGGEAEQMPAVVVLAFHVEYWDYRGWKDPFGSSMWTVRQKAYVDSLKLDTLYTPQVVVQGRAESVGTDQAAILAAIRAAPRFAAPAMQAVFQMLAPHHTLQVDFTGSLRTKVDSNGVDVMVALFENSLVTDCTDGENSGRVLSNDYVVRRMEKLISVKDVSLKKNISGTVQFALWDGFNAAKCGIILFAQNSSLQIFGVQQFQIPENI